MPADWVTAAIGVGGTVTVAISTMVFTAFRDGKQRRTDSEIRAEQWDRDAEIRTREVEEASATRQEERLADAIVTFAAALKNLSRVSAQLSANAGLTRYSTEKIDPDEAEKLLSQYESERTVQFERLLLFADADLQSRARAWSQAVQKTIPIRHGLGAIPAEQFADLMTASGARRHEFYECARKAIGVNGAIDPMPPHDLTTPGVLPAPSP